MHLRPSAVWAVGIIRVRNHHGRNSPNPPGTTPLKCLANLGPLTEVIMPWTQELEDLYTYLDNHYVLFDDYGCLVAVTDDRDTIFWCPLWNDGPEREGDHFNWGEVTGPVGPRICGQSQQGVRHGFRYEKFAGRSGRCASCLGQQSTSRGCTQTERVVSRMLATSYRQV